MKRTTITLPDDLVVRIEKNASSHKTQPALDAVVEAALEQYLLRRENPDPSDRAETLRLGDEPRHDTADRPARKLDELPRPIFLEDLTEVDLDSRHVVLKITLAPDGSGLSDASTNHDKYLAEDIYERKIKKRSRNRKGPIAMKETIVTIPAELRLRIERYAERQGDRSSLDVIVETALNAYLSGQDRATKWSNTDLTDPDEIQELTAESLAKMELSDKQVEKMRRFLESMPLEEKDDAGEPDVSVNHDKYLAEWTYERKLPRE